MRKHPKAQNLLILWTENIQCDNKIDNSYITFQCAFFLVYILVGNLDRYSIFVFCMYSVYLIPHQFFIVHVFRYIMYYYRYTQSVVVVYMFHWFLDRTIDKLERMFKHKRLEFYHSKNVLFYKKNVIQSI